MIFLFFLVNLLTKVFIIGLFSRKSQNKKCFYYVVHDHISSMQDHHPFTLIMSNKDTTYLVVGTKYVVINFIPNLCFLYFFAGGGEREHIINNMICCLNKL